VPLDPRQRQRAGRVAAVAASFEDELQDRAEADEPDRESAGGQRREDERASDQRAIAQHAHREEPEGGKTTGHGESIAQIDKLAKSLQKSG
jgi:hypothetical protein